MAGTRTLLLLSLALAVSAFLLRPLCDVAQPHPHAGEPAPCCLDVGGAGDAKPLDLAAEGGAKPLAPPPTLAYVITAVLLLGAAVRFASAAPPPRPFCARSARIRS